MKFRTVASAATAAFAACAGCLSTAASADEAPPAVGPGPVVVRTAFGGFILGYDIDQSGTEGLLSEALTRADGRHDIAVETFDQRTGAILRVVRRQIDSRNSYTTFGIFGAHAGLTEFEHVSNLFVDGRRWALMDPVSGHRVTGEWTPPFSAPTDIVSTLAPAQGVDETVALGFRNTGGDFSSYVFSTNVAANTFGPVIRVADPVFDWNLSPVIAIDPQRHRAVLGGSNGCYGCSTAIGLVDLQTGAQSTMRGFGLGSVNGIALDPTTGIACTTTEDDFSVEFYDLVNGTQTVVVLPGAFTQAQSGGAVAVDPVHHLFLVGQEFSSTARSGSSIHVYDEQGRLVESLDGFHLPASPAYMALHPAERRGYVIVTPDLTTLQSFRY